ncbi:hypothetical protein SAMN05661044_01102 [Olivibacter domesticus]|uniref:Uncharacterized protein n=1 Tax=Olivibacter domesticus TaxID=407022 RepID=A0A1H7JR06_OLID1|nr:hypothetical protein SAMN05661044_01102 [Olivibacter domesticus]
MKLRHLWILAVLICIIHEIIDLKFTTISNINDVGQVVIHVTMIFAALLTFFLFGLFFTLIFSFIPFKRRSYKEKFKWLLPIMICFIGIVMCGFSGYRVYLKEKKGIKLSPVHLIE